MNANTLWLGTGLDHAPLLVDRHGDRHLGRDCDARHASGNVRSALRDCATDSFPPCPGSPGHWLAPDHNCRPGRT